jgi:SAM-dependent methyltransferase
VSEPFSSLYAATYDELYREKDYDRECELLRRLFREHAESEVHSVLDLGCGTGSHAVRLADLGYDVVGVERSSEMLDVARAKKGARENPELLQADIRAVHLGRTVDAALLMFAVLGYLTEDADVLAALATARRHLRPGGLLVFDSWYGPAVLHERPETRFARIPLEHGELLRAVTPQLNQDRQLCRIRYELWQLEGGRVREAAEEEHEMRFFFRNELRLLLSSAGFSLVRLSAFPEIDSEPSETTWNIVAVARATLAQGPAGKQPAATRGHFG